MDIYIALDPVGFTKLLPGQFDGLTKVKSADGFNFWVEEDLIEEYNNLMKGRFPSYILADQFVIKNENAMFSALTGTYS